MNNISGVGDALVTVALAGSVFVSVSLNAARGRTALGLLCTVLPFAVVGPFVGPIIDRVRGGRRFIVFLAAIGRLAACLMMAAWIHSLLLFPAAFLSLVCSKTHAIAKASLVPGVVDSSHDLVRANARLAVGSSIFTSVGAGIGGAIYGIFGSRALLDFDVLVFALTAALSLYLLSGTREPIAPPAPAEAAARVTGGGRQLWQKLGLGLPRPPIPREVILAQVAMAGMRASSGFLTALVVFGFRRDHAPIIWYGLVAVASVGGNLGGATIAPFLRDRISEKRLVGITAVMIGIVAVIATQLSGLHERPAALILAVSIGVGASVAKTAFDAIVQRETPDYDRSRLFARFESIFQLVWVLGALIPVLIVTSLFAGFVFVACTVIITSSVFIIGVAQHRRRPVVHWGPPRGTSPSDPAAPVPAPPESGSPESVPGESGPGDGLTNGPMVYPPPPPPPWTPVPAPNPDS